MRVRTLGAAFLVALLVSSCGDDLQGEEIGCDWITGENCWKASLEAAAACLPPASSVGTLSADGTGCSYAEGYDIAFGQPVDMQRLDQQRWEFELKKDGQLCLYLSEPAATKRLLVTSLGTYQEEAKNTGVQFTCPDGARYKILDARNLLTCDNYQRHLPAVLTGWDEDEVALSLAGTGSSTPLHVFTCRLGG